MVEKAVALSALLFVLGALGALTRRNLIVILMSIELMLNAVNLALVAFSRQWGDLAGHVFVLMVIVVAAAEVAVGPRHRDRAVPQPRVGERRRREPAQMVEAHAYPLLRWIVLLPLLAAAVHGVSLALLRRPLGARGHDRALRAARRPRPSCIAFVALLELIAAAGRASACSTDMLFTWIGAGSFSADAAFLFDPLSAVMTLVVTGVGSLIHVYSVGYMDDDHREDRGFQRFFCYLNLFLFSMLVLVLGDNLVLMFLGWEGVGLCSYLLIGFWYSDRWNAYCGSKAFIVNRIGDFGFLLGIFLLVLVAGRRWTPPTVNFRELAAALPRIAEQTVTLPGWLGFLPGAPDLEAHHADRALLLPRRRGQVGADPALRLAARRDGRPDAGLGADPRRHHGDGRRLHGLPARLPLRRRRRAPRP